MLIMTSIYTHTCFVICGQSAELSYRVLQALLIIGRANLMFSGLTNLFVKHLLALSFNLILLRKMKIYNQNIRWVHLRHMSFTFFVNLRTKKKRILQTNIHDTGRLACLSNHAVNYADTSKHALCGVADMPNGNIFGRNWSCVHCYNSQPCFKFLTQ